VVDSHCHLAGSEFAADLDDVVRRAREAGVAEALVILAADDEEELARAVAVQQAWSEVRFSIGVHPHAAGAFAADPSAAARLVDAAIDRQPLTRAVGEIGLDYHYDFAPRAAQQEVFAVQLDLAARRNLPVVIHTREADADTFEVMRQRRGGVNRGVLHCFTGTWPVARQALDLGLYISLAGIVSFPKALELKEVARQVPLDRLLIETDSPFLAPVPYRGKRNEPAFVARVAAVIAELRGITAETLRAATQLNFSRLFAP
jgi:TatD DNase family protein